MQIVRVTNVPAITCPTVCFLSFTLDHAIRGVAMRKRRRIGSKEQ